MLVVPRFPSTWEEGQAKQGLVFLLYQRQILTAPSRPPMLLMELDPLNSRRRMILVTMVLTYALACHSFH